MAHHFICPQCGNRSLSVDVGNGFRGSPKGCRECGFGFIFELLDDYFPAPDAAFFVCDNDARVIACGRGAFELTGLDDERVIGRPVGDVLGLRFEADGDPVATVLEWGSARSTSRSRFAPRATCPPKLAPIFSLPTTMMAGCCSS